MWALDYASSDNHTFIDCTYITTRNFKVEVDCLVVALTDHALQRLIQARLPAVYLLHPVIELQKIIEGAPIKGDSWSVYTVDGVFIASIEEDEQGLYALIKTIIPADKLDHLHQERYDQHIKNLTDVWMTQDWHG